MPRSVLGVFGTTTADSTLRLDGFVEVRC